MSRLLVTRKSARSPRRARNAASEILDSFGGRVAVNAERRQESQAEVANLQRCPGCGRTGTTFEVGTLLSRDRSCRACRTRWTV
jgi:hypothetical protein